MGLYVITFNCFSTCDFPVKGAQERPQVGIDGGSQVMPGGTMGMVVMPGGHATPHWDPRRATHLIRLSANFLSGTPKSPKCPLSRVLKHCTSAKMPWHHNSGGF